MTRKQFSILVDNLFPKRHGLIEPFTIYGKTRYETAFDYPDYGGLPEKIAERLSSEVVDAIQYKSYELAKTLRRSEFVRILYHMCDQLGEPLRFFIKDV